jgi:lipoprotein NlpD
MREIAVSLMSVLVAGCISHTPAPVEDRRPLARSASGVEKRAPAAPLAATPAPEGFYAVKKGDTLYSIALEHGHDYREVAQWNSLDDPTKLNVGQLVRVSPPPAPAVVVGSGRGSARIESRPLETAKVEPAKPAPAAATPVLNEERKLETFAMQFAWPVKGKVVAGFAEPRQKGIDIEARSGAAVSAAAPGRVTYVGTGIAGLGKLIVIKHDQGYITVYAHNKDILVKEQQQVARGQKIAELGEKLHFQIRKGAAAVDPLLYLPGS